MMPKFKKLDITVRNNAGVYYYASFDINIDAEGVFYTNIPDELQVAFPSARKSQAAGKVSVSAKTYDELCIRLREGLNRFIEPTVSEEIIIRYYVEPNIDYVVGEDEKLYPNGVAAKEANTNYRWINLGEGFSATHKPPGMRLTVAAEAVIKKTTAYGGAKKVEYTSYYKGESHLGHENAAQKLNSYCGFRIPEKAKEMPYSDAAAMFFYDLMMAMVEITHRLDGLINNDTQLQIAIEQRLVALPSEVK